MKESPLREEPIRANLLSVEQLCEHAQTLADWHEVVARPRGHQLLRKLEENAAALAEAHRLLSRAARESHELPPAANWFLDNYYIIQEQIRMSRQHLPRKYSRELPQLTVGANAGLPRVYDVALELISHADGQVDQESLERFVTAYQRITLLKLGELWAIPIMLRLALIENLRRLAVRVMRHQQDQELSEAWADHVLRAYRDSFGAFLQEVGKMVASQPAISPAFVARFLQRLSGRIPADNVAVEWVTHCLAERGQTVEGLVQLNSQIQAADQISMSNSITSLRSLGALDWKEFVESQSVVEQILRQDPAGVYQTMDFATRDRYRHVVERLARRSALTEEQIARIAVEHAQSATLAQSRPTESDARSTLNLQRHVGYHLVDRGQAQFELAVGYSRSFVESLLRPLDRFPLVCYLGLILAVWLAMVAGAMAIGTRWGISWLDSPWRSATVFALFAAAGGQFAVSLVNWFCTLLISPRPILRLDFSKGIPREHRTLVAVPTLLIHEDSVAAIVDALEIRYLANLDDNLLFVLLTDFPDAPQEMMPGDPHLVELATAGIERLNRQYRPGQPTVFYLLHRPRLFDPVEGVWMGQERKRGKLAALNHLLRSGTADDFSAVVGDLPQLASVRYVITLDTDTMLPRDAGRKLTACLAHPLNRPRLDSRTHMVAEGYGILQPRVSTTIPQAGQSLFSRLFAGDPGIDLYTGQTSDVYQDVFGEGSFIGKGIYDVHAFDVTLEGRFPPNRILSHDLIEGCFARSGLVNDVELFEGFPGRLLADMSRRHRWIRGDWQIATWLGPRVPTARRRAGNPLSGLSRWKIFDNLRRSLTPIFLLAFLVVGWLAVPALSAYWLLLTVVIIFGPTVLSNLPRFFRKPQDKPWSLHFRDERQSSFRALAREAVHICILPYTVHCHLDAIVRTLWRLGVSRKKLLEWTTSSDAERRATGKCRDHYEVMWTCPATAVSLTALLTLIAPSALVFAGPLLLAWVLGPLLAWWISQPYAPEAIHLTAGETRQLRRWARQTWHFFDVFSTEQDHWIVPDNVQELGQWTVAPRSSPTNIGLCLLADLGAHDLGYLPATALLDRIERTLKTMQRLERYRGHLYNWYDTRTLRPSEPRYVSSVDSGNLWGSLIVLQAGLREVRGRPLVSPRLLEGLQDTLQVLATLSDSAGRGGEFGGRLAQLQIECGGVLPVSARRAWGLLTRIHSMAVDLAASVPSDQPILHEWTRALVRQCATTHADLSGLAFWVHAPVPTKPLYAGLPVELQHALDELKTWVDQLDVQSRVDQLPGAAEDLMRRVTPLLESLVDDGNVQDDGKYGKEREDLRAALISLLQWADVAASSARKQAERITGLTALCENFCEMDFRFLFHPERRLLAIGYNATEHRRDTSYYDLLASEARLASYLCISHRQVPPEHWFALGRMMTLVEGRPTLLSWSGSMFEYLMAPLLMPAYPGTVLDLSCRAAVRRQIRYGRQRGIPWGISESCYALTDAQQVYQYRAFGVPGLGLDRGLADELVIAPYASAIALGVAPHEACSNLHHLEQSGYLSCYGFFDAIDYTPHRRLSADEPVVCRTVMAHHSAMTVLAFVQVLLGAPMQRRFLENALCKAHDLLLQERMPQAVRPVHPEALDAARELTEPQMGMASVRIFDTPHTAAPEVHLLSNGSYHVLLTNSGGGMSHCKGLAVTRWEDDATRDHLGMFCYLRDVETGKYWSNTYQPTRRNADKYLVTFSQGQVEYRTIYGQIDAQTLVGVSPEDNVEVRRLTLTNLARAERTIEVTTYAEIVLASPESDRAHRVFSNLFVQTEIHPEAEAILVHRRPRSPGDPTPWMFHLLHVQAERKTGASFETDRERFLGRMRTTENPSALQGASALSGSDGPVLDPIVSVRQAVSLESDESAVVHIITGYAETREQALAAVARYRDPRLAARVFEISRTHSQLNLQQLNMTEANAQLYSHLASSLLYPNARYRLSSARVGTQLRSQSALWPMGIGGDRPIALVRCSNQNGIPLVEQMLDAHAYWRGKGLQVDLVVWIESESGYRQETYDRIMGMIASGTKPPQLDQPGGVFVRRSEEHSLDNFLVLEAAARICLSDEAGTLEEQLRDAEPEPIVARVESPTGGQGLSRSVSKRAAPDLLFFNGFGGFTRDGRESISIVDRDHPTPAPWCNVLANAQFGTVVSESGTGFTWCENSHEYRLTPWRNDPVSDPPGEVIYVHDDETGEFFSATPLPAPSKEGYLCRHGFGYSVWETRGLELDVQLWTFVSIELPIKFFLVTFKNRSGRRRRISVTCFVEWVLGEYRQKTAPYVVTEIDPQSGALLANNPFGMEFGDRVAFLNCSASDCSATCDRTEILGRNGSPSSPLGLRRMRLSGKAGAALDPAAALQCRLELAPDETREVVFVLGSGANGPEARKMAQNFAEVGATRQELSRVWDQWNELLGAVQVETPEPSLNVLTNGWLVYQTLACRMWARSAFYQSGGAFGFRDQLQDSLGLLFAAPWLTREHLLRCAAHQFREGDVQHWWHAPTGQGVRTRISDDYLWLPLTVAKYVSVTGDWGVLDETAPFLVERRLEPHEESLFGRPQPSEEVSSLYEHCRLAIRHGLQFGAHGLPLMGAGDWNDGMNHVGAAGQGESVWLAIFLVKVLRDFANIADRRNDAEFAGLCRSHAQELTAGVQEHAWDGQWFLRAFFDNGEPLGSQHNDECQIDSLPQSWAVMAQAAPPERLRAAMKAVDERLVRRDLQLIQLLDPPFDRGPMQPGYIKGYPPGIRENGGQYTHAAIWAAIAATLLGDGPKAWEYCRMINPIFRSVLRGGIGAYRVEPYVMAADISSAASHPGRGGWTWYTGSASWMYQLILEFLLGITLVDGTRLRFQPCLPQGWKHYTVHFRFRRTHYRIQFEITGGPAHHVTGLLLDGVEQAGKELALVDDGRSHEVIVALAPVSG
ncbi:MAG: GH36-type glycosyl hydrolase domain-containing protein [Pirellulaceae bacterium]